MDPNRFPIESQHCAYCGHRFEAEDKFVRTHSDDHELWLLYFHRDCWILYCDHGGTLGDTP